MNSRKISMALAVAAVSVFAGPALATGASHTVSVGGIPLTSSTPFTAATATSGTNVYYSIKNNSGTRINLSCIRSTASGTVQPGLDIASIARTTWVGCSFPGGPLAVSQVGTWTFHTSQGLSSAANETVAGHLDNFELQFQMAANPVICRFTIAGTGPNSTGSASTSLNESTQTLTVAATGFIGRLQLKDVSGCFGQLQNGNLVDFSATFALTAAGGAVNVTS